MQAYPRLPIKCGVIIDVKINKNGNLVITWEFEQGNAGETEIEGPVPKNEMPEIGYVFIELGHMTDWLTRDHFNKYYELV